MSWDCLRIRDVVPCLSAVRISGILRPISAISAVSTPRLAGSAASGGGCLGVKKLRMSSAFSDGIVGRPPLSGSDLFLLSTATLAAAVTLDFGHDIVGGVITLSHLCLFLLRSCFAWVGGQKHVEQCVYHGIVLSIFDWGSTCWAGIRAGGGRRMRVACFAILVRKPFLEAGATE